MSGSRVRCCECDTDARYLAQTTYTLRPRRLCVECAAEDRALGDVVWIRLLSEARPTEAGR